MACLITCTAGFHYMGPRDWTQVFRMLLDPPCHLTGPFIKISFPEAGPVLPKLASNLQSSCLSLLSDHYTGVVAVSSLFPQEILNHKFPGLLFAVFDTVYFLLLRLVLKPSTHVSLLDNYSWAPLYWVLPFLLFIPCHGVSKQYFPIQFSGWPKAPNIYLSSTKSIQLVSNFESDGRT